MFQAHNLHFAKDMLTCLILYHYFNSSFELSVDIFDYLDTLVELEKRSEFSFITIEVIFLLREPLLSLSMIVAY